MECDVELASPRFNAAALSHALSTSHLNSGILSRPEVADYLRRRGQPIIVCIAPFGLLLAVSVFKCGTQGATSCFFLFVG